MITREEALKFSRAAGVSCPSSQALNRLCDLAAIHATEQLTLQLEVEQAKVKVLREALNNQQFWLRGALDFRNWSWDWDQLASAEWCYSFANEALKQTDSCDSSVSAAKEEK